MLQSVDVGERSLEAYRGVAPDATIEELRGGPRTCAARACCTSTPRPTAAASPSCCARRSRCSTTSGWSRMPPPTRPAFATRSPRPPSTSGTGNPPATTHSPACSSASWPMAPPHGIAFPRRLILLARALVNVEATASLIDPQLTLAALAEPMLPTCAAGCCITAARTCWSSRLTFPTSSRSSQTDSANPDPAGLRRRGADQRQPRRLGAHRRAARRPAGRTARARQRPPPEIGEGHGSASGLEAVSEPS